MLKTGERRLGTHRRGWRATTVGAVLAVVASALIVVDVPTAVMADGGSSCGATINPIACENSKPGTDPSIWDIDGAGDPSIQGFATDISVNAGSRIDFKIDTNAASYDIDIYRTGWYQGLGARHIASVTPSAALPQKQPECVSDVTTELYDCGTWKVSASWSVPSTAVSGVYIALLHRNDTGGESHIIFIVRNDGNHSDIVFQTSDPTWEAYNPYGGSDFYQGAANGRAYKISYNRPFATRGTVESRSFYFSSEFATVKFLERNGYDVSYMAGVDTDRYGAQLLNHKVFLSVGHDEYWSAAQRANVTAARDAGVNLQFLSGNEMYWHTRYEPSADGSNTPYRTLVSYKETWGNAANKDGAKIDTSTPEWTGTWRDPRFADASNGGHLPENALTGTMYMVNNDDLAVTVDSQEGKLRLWRNTSLANLPAGSVAQLAPHTIGYESDEDVDNGFRPSGLIHLSTTVGSTPQYLRDYGNVVTAGTTEHHLTLYRASSGALVFSAGSVGWAWGLADGFDGSDSPADPRMQQAQVNLLADMGAQPTTLMSSLVATAMSTDGTPPTTTITSPTAGQSIAQGTMVTMTGTASDVGGRVAGVEVSTDGGATWRLAQGTTSWSYSYVQQAGGLATVKARAIDDSANFTAAGVSVTVSVTGPASVFGQVTPPIASADDAQSLELGLRFSTEVDGYVTGVRFYKGQANTGQHIGSLWSAQGTRLASVIFTNESSTGWQKALFSQPVAVVAGQQYTVSYTAPQGGYAYNEYYWPYQARATSPVTVSSGTGAAAAGVFGSAGIFPTTTFHDANYYVDPLFESATASPVRLTNQSPAVGAAGVAKDSIVSAAFTRPVDTGSVHMSLAKADGTSVPGAQTYDSSTRQVRFTPSALLDPVTTYRVTLTATPADATTFDPGADWTFTTANDSSSNTCPCSLYTSTDVPDITSAADSSPVTVGTSFTVSESGYIAGIKFYKGAGNTGTHVGSLWSAASGTPLAQVSFTSESATGWQTAWFDAPIAVSPGTLYVASYVAPTGHYAVTAGAFTSAFTRGPLQVPAQGGAFTYVSGFPSQASTTSYYVDPVFVRSTAGPQLVSTTPAAGATAVSASTVVAATFSEALTATPSVVVSIGGTPVAGTTARSSDGKTATFTPTSALPFDSAVSVSISGVVSASGAGYDRTWSFHTQTDPSPQNVTFFGTGAPSGLSFAAEGQSLELGMSFQSSLNGRITALRFYKAPGDAGTHTGTLWSSSGAALASVVFQGETSEGWQTAQLAAPVSIVAGQTYTVSYLTPQGNYAYAGSYFATAATSGPLTAAATGNGVFRYGGGGTMPQSTWNATNYYVDVVFSAGDGSGPALSVTDKTPVGDAVSPDTRVTATLSGDAATATIALTQNGVAVAGSSVYDASTRTVTFTPDKLLAYSTGYAAKVAVSGQTLAQWTFTTADPDLDGVVNTLFQDITPAIPANSDAAAVELGTAFSVAYPGSVTALRFYKGTGNSGTHVGSLWTASGQKLASVTFSDETADGWQRAALAEPVALIPGVTYVASYFAPNGHYAAAAGFFSAPVTSGYVTGPAGDNGLFIYGAGGGFPTQSWNSTAYFVDAEVTFGTLPAGPSPDLSPSPTPSPSPSPTPPPTPALTATTPASGATGVNPATATVTATLTNATSAAITVKTGTTTVAGTSSFNAATGVATFTPTAALGWTTVYTATVTANGAAVAGGTWSFTTMAKQDQVSLFPTGAPSAPNTSSTLAIQVATRFKATAPGVVTAIRFYKGSSNTGTHTGYLWASNGTKLATVTFTGETASGWQTAVLSTPVRLTVGAEYRVGMYSTTKFYALTTNGLSAAVTNGPITTLATGGAYSYNTSYPSTTSKNKYWVDIIFDPDN